MEHELTFCFYSSLALLAFVVLISVLVFAGIIFWIKARNERQLTVKHEKNIKKLLKKNE